MSDYNKKYAKEKYKRVFTNIQKNVADEFENNLKKLGYSKSLIFKTAIELFNNEDDYFLEKIKNKQDEKEITLAQLINKMKDENKGWGDSENIISEYFTFIDETDLYKITLSCKGGCLYTGFVYELENEQYTINTSQCQTPIEEEIYKNRNRKVVVQNVEIY